MQEMDSQMELCLPDFFIFVPNIFVVLVTSSFQENFVTNILSNCRIVLYIYSLVLNITYSFIDINLSDGTSKNTHQGAKNLTKTRPEDIRDRKVSSVRSSTLP